MNLELQKLFTFSREGTVLIVGGTKACSEIPGFLSEKGKLKSKTTGEEYSTINWKAYRGDHLEVELSFPKMEARKFSLGSLFPDKVVVVVTDLDHLKYIAPIFSNEEELEDWKRTLHEYATPFGVSGDLTIGDWEDKMSKLAEFLYKNQAEES